MLQPLRMTSRGVASAVFVTWCWWILTQPSAARLDSDFPVVWADDVLGQHSPEAPVRRALVFEARTHCIARCLDEEKILEKCTQTPCPAATEPDPQKVPEAELVSEMSPPSLYCRDKTMLTLTWNLHVEDDVNPVFAVYLRMHNTTWEPFGLATRPKVTIPNLTHNTSYQIQVQTVIGAGLLGARRESEWIRTLEDDFIPLPVQNLRTIGDYERTRTHLNVDIQWDPSEDRTCKYEVEFWNKVRYEVSHTSHMKTFTARLKNLEYDSTYTVQVVSYNGKINKQSSKVLLNITTPTCLQVHSNDLSMCAPEIPGSCTSSFRRDAQSNSYEMLLKWTPPALLPNKYAISIIPVRRRNKSITRVVSGFSSALYVKDIEASSTYLICIMAMSVGGNSTQLCSYHKTPAFIIDENQADRSVEIFLASSGVILCSVLCFLLFYYCKKQDTMKECATHSAT